VENATGRPCDADRLRRLGAATVVDYTAAPVDGLRQLAKGEARGKIVVSIAG
jgi:hypothetical protein